MRPLTVVPIGQVHTDKIHLVQGNAMDPEISLVFDERALNSLSDAVDYTLDKWAGEIFKDGIMDQEELISLKHFLHGALLEVQFNKPSADR